MTLSLIIYGGVVAALLAAELRENRVAQFFFKPLAAVGFIFLALQFGALDSTYGQIVFIALVMCAFGDVLLLARKSRPLFLFGMVAFALGHIFLIMAFLVPYNISWKSLAIGTPIILCIGVFQLHHLRPKIPETERASVDSYSVVILIMLTAAFAYMSRSPLVILGAIMFAISDMFVARDRFITPNSKNALAITPLYFGAQALFALSTQV